MRSVGCDCGRDGLVGTMIIWPTERGLPNASISASARSGDRTPRWRAFSLGSIFMRPCESISYMMSASWLMVSSSVRPSIWSCSNASAKV